MKIRSFAAALSAVASLAGSASMSHATQPQPCGSDLMLHNVALRPGVHSDIHVRVFHNPHWSCAWDHTKTIFTVHGAAGSANTWEPLSDALFDRFDGDERVCRVAAIDLPGHGGSSPPEGLVFGDLTLEDFGAAVVGTLHRLKHHGIRPRLALGHSQGGIVLQLAQQALLDDGSSLREAFGIRRAALLGSVAPQAVPWDFADSGAGAGLIMQFASNHPTLGQVFDLPPELWVPIVFTNLNGAIPPSAPAPAEVVQHEYLSLESFTALASLVGAPSFSRPDVDPGVFADHLGTRLGVVAFEHDTLIPPDNSEALYEHLTGEEASCAFSVVLGEDAVHGAPINIPDAVLDALEDVSILPW
jgi:pimeloyl-ACP methyl ester carboxylesterase